ncbi:MAG TPA: cation:proton antiporter [Alphaproteobacteria bacterium]|nr:cation:proton antiporter [Alphaproteobacteria bacterium]
MAEITPILPILVIMSAVVLVVGILSKKLRQPYVISYIIAGFLLGPSVFAILQNDLVISNLGNIGIVLLLFFVGMEIDLKKLLSGWKSAFLGTIFQVFVSVFAMWIFGRFFGWGIEQVILLGFVISLSSTAVVLKILEEWKETDTHAGRNVISILLAQDFAFIPMIIILGLFSGGGVDSRILALQLTGMILMLTLMAYVFGKRQISLPFSRFIKGDHEMQVFLAIALCFGMSLISGLFELSTALGAFLAGLLISASKETQWVHHALNPFRIFFVALFFIYVGIIINLQFLIANWVIILTMVAIVFALNTAINTLIIYLLHNNWRDSLYAGAMLSQIGEFSLLLAAVGLSAGVIAAFDYQMIVQVIALTLLLSPLWILFNKKIVCHINHFNTKEIKEK